MINIHSKYSIKYGVKSLEWIINWAKKNKYRNIAITDINSTTAILNAVKLSQENGTSIIAGADIRNGIEQQYVLLAKNNRGFHEINTFLSTHLHAEKDFPAKVKYLPNCFAIYPLENVPKQLKSNEYIGVRPHQVNKLKNDFKGEYGKLVILQTMTFESKREFNAHRLLRAIDHNCLLSALNIKDQASEKDQFTNKTDLYDCFQDHPDLILQTERLLEECNIHFGFGDEVEPQNIQTYTGTKADDKKLLRSLCEKGIPRRYSEVTGTVRERIDRELEVIEKKDYLAYFLVTWDIINYAHSQGYFHVGRGSGANSIVAYLLGITDVDPLELDLYFE